MRRMDKEMKFKVIQFLIVMVVCTILMGMMSKKIEAKAEEADSNATGATQSVESATNGENAQETDTSDKTESEDKETSDKETSNKEEAEDKKDEKKDKDDDDDDDEKNKHRTNSEPSISLNRNLPSDPVSPGEEFDLRFTIRNNGNADMKDVIVSVKSGEQLFVVDAEGSKRLSEIEADEGATITFKMRAAKELKGEFSQVEVSIKYFWDGNDYREESEDTLYLNVPVSVGTQTKQPYITIERGEFLQGNIVSDQEFDMIVNLTNNSEKDVFGLVATFETSDEIALIDQTEGQQIGDLKSGENAPMILHFKAAKELKNSSYPISVNLKFNYVSAEGMTEATQTDKILIPTTPKDPTADPTPYMIVDSYSYGKEKIQAGEDFNLHLKFRNTSQALACENVIISLDMGEGVTIASSSNTFYESTIAPGGETEEDIVLEAGMELKEKSPRVTVNFKYEYVDDEERKEATASSVIAIPVYQKDRFSTGTATYTTPISAGEEMTVSVPYINRGRGVIYNVEGTLNLENIDIQSKALNVGNIDAGKDGTVDFILTPLEEGTYKGSVTIAYENSAGEMKKMDVPIEFTAETAYVEEVFDEFTEEEEESPALPLPVIIGGGVVLAGAVGFVGFRKWKKKKAQKAETILEQENNYWGEEEK